LCEGCDDENFPGLADCRHDPRHCNGGDIVSKGYLPKSRAEFCEEEYEQVQDAVDK
jgi:hypothetical protein